MANDDIYYRYKRVFKNSIDDFISQAESYIMGMTLEERNRFQIRLKIDIEKEEEKRNIKGYNIAFFGGVFIVLVTGILQNKNWEILLNINVERLVLGLIIFTSYFLYTYLMFQLWIYFRKDKMTYYKAWLEVYSLCKDKYINDISNIEEDNEGSNDNNKFNHMEDIESNINYNKLIRRLTSWSTWGINPVTVNISMDIIKRIEKIVKNECITKYDKKMLISIMDGYTDSINSINTYVILMVTVLSTFVVGIIVKIFELTLILKDSSLIMVCILVLASPYFYTGNQKRKTKYNIIRSVAKELLKEEASEK
jgi:hypothetical protein